MRIAVRPRQQALAVVAVLAVVFAGMASCSFKPFLPEGAELIPADTTLAVSVDVPALLESKLYEIYKANESLFGRNRLNFYRFAEATGLDPSKDIHRLLFMARAGTEDYADMSALAIGTFDGRKVHDYLKESGLPSHEIEGMDIFEFIVIAGRCAFCVGVIDAGTAVFGNGETLETIARIHAGTEKGLSEEERASRLLRRVGDRASVWGILRTDDIKENLMEAVRNFSVDSSALSALGPIHEVTFSFDTTDPMRVLVEMSADTDKDAFMVADVLKGAESLGRLALREARPELSVVMSDLVIEADTGIVRIAGSIPAQDVDAVSNALGLDWIPRGLTPRAPDPPAPPSP